jgi:hypothetical protein
MSAYSHAIKAVKMGAAHNTRPWDNQFGGDSWVVDIGTVEVLFHHNSSAHIEQYETVILNPWRLRRALRKVGLEYIPRRHVDFTPLYQVAP